MDFFLPFYSFYATLACLWNGCKRGDEKTLPSVIPLRTEAAWKTANDI